MSWEVVHTSLHCRSLTKLVLGRLLTSLKVFRRVLGAFVKILKFDFHDPPLWLVHCIALLWVKLPWNSMLEKFTI